MKKSNILSYYLFFGNSIKMSSLSNPRERAEFIKFFRELRKIVTPIFNEMKGPEDDPSAELNEDIKRQVLDEEFNGTLPKIKEDTLINIISENRIDIPVLSVMGELEPFFE